MKTAVSLPDDVFDAAERLARRLGMTRSGLYAVAIAEFVAAREDSRVREALDAVHSDEPSEIDDAWALAQADAVPEEDW